MTDKTKIQWHPAFCDAMRLTLRDNDDDLSYEDEHMLSHKPLQIDLLVIKKKSSRTPIQSSIGRIFRGYNIIEYKSPRDALNIDTYFKVLGYGCLYKALEAECVNDIRSDDITLTMVRHSKPKQMFEDLKYEGIDVRLGYPGIYYLCGNAIFLTQVIVTKELPQDEFTWLKVLTENISAHDAAQVVMDMNDMPAETWEREAADAVIQVAISANESTFDELRREDPIMCDALKELMRPEFEAEMKVRTEEVTQQVTQSVTQQVTQSVTQKVTQEVKQADAQKERDNNIERIKSLNGQNVSVDVLKTTYGDELVYAALGLKDK